MPGLLADAPSRIKRDVTIAQKRLDGLSYSKLATQFNLSKTTIHRVLKQDEIKEILEQGTTEMISMIPIAADTHYKALNNYDKNDVLALKAAENILKTGNILPTNNPNQTINNIVNIQNNIVLSPTVAARLSNAFDNTDEDIIDIEEQTDEA